MWILLMIVFSQPYHVADVNILGTFLKKTTCVAEQNRAMAIGTVIKTSFGCVKIEGTFHKNNDVSRKTRR